MCSRIASNKYGEAQPTMKKKRFAKENLERTLIDVVKNEFWLRVYMFVKFASTVLL